MRNHLHAAVVAAALVAIAASTNACTIRIVHKQHPDAGTPASSGAGECGACLSNSDCADGACVQIGSDDACATSCATDADCAPGETCGSANGSDGNTVQVCIPTSGTCAKTGGCGTCGADQICDTTTGTCVDAPPSNTCGTLVGPATVAQCSSCNASTDCQANGCYGGWFCDTSNNKCHAPPSDCGGAVDQGADAGPITGSVDVSGGTVNRLFFAVVGDTRPPSTNATDEYPTTVINQIYADIESLNPKPQFVLTTGDFMFASKNGSENTPQIQKYASAAATFHGGPVFPVLGNHECTGYTADNCASTSTKNLQAFKQTLVQPLGLSDLYYSVPFHSDDGSWSAKLIVAACNAWDDTQKSWLEQQLATPTTYTLVSRHEPSSATTAPCVSEMDALLSSTSPPIDLLIVGHTHTFEKVGHEIVVGNGGAPLTGSAPFGFATVEMLPGTGFRVSEIDASSKAVLRSFVIAH